MTLNVWVDGLDKYLAQGHGLQTLLHSACAACTRLFLCCLIRIVKNPVANA